MCKCIICDHQLINDIFDISLGMESYGKIIIANRNQQCMQFTLIFGALSQNILNCVRNWYTRQYIIADVKWGRNSVKSWSGHTKQSDLFGNIFSIISNANTALLGVFELYISVMITERYADWRWRYMINADLNLKIIMDYSTNTKLCNKKSWTPSSWLLDLLKPAKTTIALWK